MKYGIDYFQEWRESFDDATTYDQDMFATCTPMQC